MHREMLRTPELAEPELARIVESFRELPVSDLEVYSYFDIDGTPEAAAIREQNKAAFLADEIHNPKLNYPKLAYQETTKLLSDSEHAVLDLMKDATKFDHDMARVRAVEDILRTAYLNVAMLQISAEMQHGDLMDEERQKCADLFNLANDEVYGRPDETIFFGLVQKEKQRAQAIIADDRSVQLTKDVAGEFLEGTSHIDITDNVDNFEVSAEAISAIREVVEAEFADFLSLVPESGEALGVPEMARLFMAAHELRNTGWSVRVVPGKSQLESSQSQQTTLIGEKRKALPVGEVGGLLIHENGIHVGRRKNGDGLGDPLLKGLGLAGYADFEEGLGVSAEEVLQGKTRESGTQYYLAIGFARGLDGSPRDFRDTFELAWRREALKSAKDGQINQAGIDRARKQAYIQCVRIFRGTPCDIPGMVYTKDQAYLRGNRQAWGVLTQIASLPLDERRQAYCKLLAAKYDPTNENHIRLVNGVLERAKG